MPNRIYNKSNYYDKLTELMNVLRKECPWDAEQTLSSLRTYTLEEVHEVFEAIEQAVEKNQWDGLKQELGDLLLQILFYACIAKEQGQFDMGDVADSLIEKMIHRHPHVFSDTQSNDLSRQWEELKDSEHLDRKSLMDGIPPLPALATAHKMQRRASRVGFDWAAASDVMIKMREELEELEVEVNTQASHERLEDEFGDVLFTLVNLGRKLNVDAELALMHTNRKFAARFRKMEDMSEQKESSLDSMSLEEMEGIYSEAKHALRSANARTSNP
ncbi:MAG: nucleoside triphosphate pyrophosphohydrolase [Mariprofundaceae bacterium]|nr:nucleoside triphosphate pyrophosphohydrolase [Mariprofundaceae bacterium]